MAAKYISTFNFCPKYVNNIDKIALQKKPEIKIFKSKFLFKTEEIPPKTESNAANTPIAKKLEYVYEIVGALIPKITPAIQPIRIAINITLYHYPF